MPFACISKKHSFNLKRSISYIQFNVSYFSFVTSSRRNVKQFKETYMLNENYSIFFQESVSMYLDCIFWMQS